MHALVVGGGGLVGSAFARAFAARGTPCVSVGRGDMAGVSGARCGLLVLCCGNPHKGRANADPAADFAASVAPIAHYVHAVRATRTVLVSSVDVYPDPGSLAGTDEDAPLDVRRMSPYGFHKYLAELCVLRFAPRPLVLRVPALVGPGLRKNAIFDHLAQRPLFVAGASRLNVLHTDDLAAHTLRLVERGVEGVLNLGATAGLAIDDLPGLTGLPNTFGPDAASHVQHYELAVARAGAHVGLCDSATAVRRHAAELATAAAVPAAVG